MTWYRIGSGTSAHARDEDEPVAECGARPINPVAEDVLVTLALTDWMDLAKEAK